MERLSGLTNSKGNVSGSAHVIHHVTKQNSDGKANFFFKQNKYSGALGRFCSEMEWAFSKLAQSFAPNMTPEYDLVTGNREDLESFLSSTTVSNQIKRSHSFFKEEARNEDDILGILSRDAKESIANNEKITLLEAEKKDFFSQLYRAHQEQSSKRKIDLKSLAAVLVFSYLLEEDDLHKGNIGYYITNENDIEVYHFFKIDHDLMFAEQVMSRVGGRLANIFYDENSFKIHPEDLDTFPDLNHSGNHYWPTKKRILVKRKKAYRNPDEISAFSQLQFNKEFNQCKWQFFLDCLEQKPWEDILKGLPEDKVYLVQRALNTRQQELKVALSLSDEFRRFIQEKKQIHEIEQVDPKQDNRLTAAIKLGCYCPENNSADMLQKQAKGHELYQIAHDSLKESNKFKYYQVVLDLYIKGVRPAHNENEDYVMFFIKQNFSIEQMLEDKQLSKDADFLRAVRSLVPSRSVLKKEEQKISVNSDEDLTSLIKRLEHINQDGDYSLKTAKNLALALIYRCDFQPDQAKVLQSRLKTDSNLRFIRQLRSNLWIVRGVRGLYGSSTTYRKMNQFLQVSESQNLRP